MDSWSVLLAKCVCVLYSSHPFCYSLLHWYPVFGLVPAWVACCFPCRSCAVCIPPLLVLSYSRLLVCSIRCAQCWQSSPVMGAKASILCAQWEFVQGVQSRAEWHCVPLKNTLSLCGSGKQGAALLQYQACCYSFVPVSANPFPSTLSQCLNSTVTRLVCILHCVYAMSVV